MSKKIQKQIEELVNDINKWNHEYFDLEKPSVSDRVYDSHLKLLIDLENKYPELILPNSPTKKIGSSTKENFKKVKHKKAMLSLAKAYSFEEINKFLNDVQAQCENEFISFFIEPKIDGLSISLHYENGVLVKAITRGDGIVGEDVSNNVISIIKDIPINIPYKQNIEVRGEIFLSKSRFKTIIETEGINYANPRNLASGTLRQLNLEIVKRRNLSSFIYEVVENEKHNLFTQEEIIDFLIKNNFNVFKTRKIVNNLEEIKLFIKDFDVVKKNLDYETDGIVIKLNETKFYNKIGYTSKFPKYSIAYKFDDEIVNSILEDIFITIGRTGIVTYNAKFKPVLLKGTIVGAATLHNYNYIKDLNLNIGDEISIKKAGEIIPKIVGLVNKNTIDVFPKINICPFCKKKLIETNTQNLQICSNVNCDEQNIRKIVHFASREAMQIDGLAEGIVRKFYKLNILTKIEDIYELKEKKDFIIQQKGMGEKFWSNLNIGIENSKKNNLEKLIFALGINQLGSKNAKQLASFINIFENIKNIDFEKLEMIKDIGPILIKEIKCYLNNPYNIKLINYLISIGINPKYQIENINDNNFFYQKSIVVTGTLKIVRSELINLLELNGAKITNSISKNTDFLLVGENPGSKLEKAKNLKIKIIYEDELNELLNKEYN